jgi:hypothetical protein
MLHALPISSSFACSFYTYNKYGYNSRIEEDELT